MKLSLEEICRAHQNGSLSKLIDSLGITQDELFDPIIKEFDRMSKTIVDLEDEIDNWQEMDWEDTIYE